MKLKSLNTLVLLAILTILAIVLYSADVMPYKIIVILMLALIFSAMISAFYHMVSKKGDSTSFLVSLTWRIGLSVFLFLFLVISAQFGWIKPNSTLSKIEKEAATRASAQSKKPSK